MVSYVLKEHRGLVKGGCRQLRTGRVHKHVPFSGVVCKSFKAVEVGLQNGMVAPKYGRLLVQYEDFGGLELGLVATDQVL